MPKPASFGLFEAPSDYDYLGYEPDSDEEANGDEDDQKFEPLAAGCPARSG